MVFHLAKVKFDRVGEGGREEWKNVVSIFEKDQYWSQLDPRKVFQRISNTLICKVRDVFC